MEYLYLQLNDYKNEIEELRGKKDNIKTLADKIKDEKGDSKNKKDNNLENKNKNKELEKN